MTLVPRGLTLKRFIYLLDLLQYVVHEVEYLVIDVYLNFTGSIHRNESLCYLCKATKDINSSNWSLLKSL